jgi:hypothetical protein
VSEHQHDDGEVSLPDEVRSSEAERGPCVVCGAPSVQTFFAASGMVARDEVLPDGSTRRLNVPLPPIHACRAHYYEILSERLPIGFCSAETCRCWGQLGEASPCGEPFVEP